MEKIKFRDLQRKPFGEIESLLPAAVTHDSQTKLVILSVMMYNKLVEGCRKEGLTNAAEGEGKE